MFEKVNPSHPDKVADRIAGALVDMAYKLQDDPKIAVEVLIGHGRCLVIAETSVSLGLSSVESAVRRIAGCDVALEYLEVPQDAKLAQNQLDGLRCGDNGIFKGCVVTNEQRKLSEIVRRIYEDIPYDGKFIIDGGKFTACQSNAYADDVARYFGNSVSNVNPLGYWTGGVNVDSGATNRKLGSDMGDAVTGGGLHGKDLSKADVSVNIWAHLEAQRLGEDVHCVCSIGDRSVKVADTGRVVEFEKVVDEARQFIIRCGGFERFAEWGLV